MSTFISDAQITGGTTSVSLQLFGHNPSEGIYDTLSLSLDMAETYGGSNVVVIATHPNTHEGRKALRQVLQKLVDGAREIEHTIVQDVPIAETPVLPQPCYKFGDTLYGIFPAFSKEGEKTWEIQQFTVDQILFRHGTYRYSGPETEENDLFWKRFTPASDVAESEFALRPLLEAKLNPSTRNTPGHE